MKKFVLDTSVLVQDPTGWPNAFKEDNTFLPIGVLEELNGLKNHPEVGWNAREALRVLDVICQTGDIVKGINMTSGGSIRVYTNTNGWDRLPHGFERSFDNSYLIACLELMTNSHEDVVILITKDRPLRLKAAGMGIRAEDYRNDKTVPVEQLRTGRADLTITPTALNAIYRSSTQTLSSAFDASGIPSEVVDTLLHNTCCRLDETTSGTFALAIYNKARGEFRLVPKPKTSRGGEIGPKNDEQALGLALAGDRDSTLVTLAGRTGSGKTMMALLAGFNSLRRGECERLVIFRPTDEVGESIGFLPGTVEEKMSPRLWPIVNNLALIAGGRRGLEAGRKEIQKMISEGLIEISPVNFIRGGTYNHVFMIIDEAQNLTPHVVKTAITRAGEGTLVRLTGDLRQIDKHLLDARSNGFAKVISAFQGQPFYGHFLFLISVRSPLAEIADTLL